MKFLNLTFALLLLHPLFAAAGTVIRFQEPVIQVASEEFIVSIFIDADDQQAGHQLIPNGLFSFALKLTFDPEKFELAADPAFVVPQLNYNGFVPGAVIQTTSSNLVIKGNISLDSSTPAAYTGAKLADVSFRALSASGITSTLTLTSARSNPNETLIVDGQGTSLDSQVTFQSASVQIISSTTPTLLIARKSEGGFEITFEPLPGMNHYLESSSNLSQWSATTPEPQNSGSINLISTPGPLYFRLRMEPTTGN